MRNRIRKASGTIVKLLLDTGKIQLAAITDIRNDEIKKITDGMGYTNVKFYSDAEKMLKNEKPDGVLVATRCSSHTNYAVLVAKYGIPMSLIGRVYLFLSKKQEKILLLKKKA